jgi:RecA-family ATPase
METTVATVVVYFGHTARGSIGASAQQRSGRSWSRIGRNGNSAAPLLALEAQESVANGEATHNNALERTVAHCGPHPGCQQVVGWLCMRQAAMWPAAQLGR